MAQASRVGDSSGGDDGPASRPERSRSSSRTSRDRRSSSTPSGPRATAAPSASTERTVRGAFDRHGGYEVDNAGDGSSTPSRRPPTRCGRWARRSGRSREGRSGSGPASTPESRSSTRRNTSARRPPGSADHGGGARRAGTLSPHDPRPARRELRGPRPRRAPPQGSLAPQRLFQLGTGEFPHPRTLTGRTSLCRRRSSSGASGS